MKRDDGDGEWQFMAFSIEYNGKDFGEEGNSFVVWSQWKPLEIYELVVCTQRTINVFLYLDTLLCSSTDFNDNNSTPSAFSSLTSFFFSLETKISLPFVGKVNPSGHTIPHIPTSNH